MNATTHPSPEQLLNFARGDLAGDEFESIEQHVGECDSCCQWMSRQPDSTFVSLARNAATVGFRTSTPTSETTSRVPEELQSHPRYEVFGVLGAGGMGLVYKAQHRLMQRLVALKVVHPAIVANQQAVERFHREVRVAAKLHHPNIVVSFDADQAGDLHFLAMEFVEGESLAQKISRDGPASVRDACDWIRQAALGLEHAHEQGMIHRDIKPQNLMLTPDGRVKILDFGLSRIAADLPTPGNAVSAGSENHSFTQAGSVLGTPDYIAPEQITHSASADIRSDIYSLGCTLFYLLTGRPPFSQGTVIEKLHAQRTMTLPKLDQHRADVPDFVLKIIDRMTAKEPGDRFATPREVAEALAVAMEDSSNLKIAPKRIDRRVFVAASLGGLMLLGGLAAYQAGAFASKPKLLVMLPSKGLWFPDYEELVKAAAKQKVELTFASTVAKPSSLLTQSPQGVAVPDVVLGPEVSSKDYSGIVFIGYDTNEFMPGGSASAETDRLLNEFQLQHKVVASLCTGQRVLAEYGALRGKTVSKCDTLPAGTVAYAGAKETSQAVERDGLVVTAGHAEAAADFLKIIVAAAKP